MSSGHVIFHLSLWVRRGKNQIRNARCEHLPALTGWSRALLESSREGGGWRAGDGWDWEGFLPNIPCKSLLFYLKPLCLNPPIPKLELSPLTRVLAESLSLQNQSRARFYILRSS